MSTNNPYAAPKTTLEIETHDDAPPLWNPDVAGLWSLLFTPVFGSILVLKNWQAIGELEQIRAAKIWLAISILTYLVTLFFRPLGFIYIVVWYIGSQKKQTEYVKKRWEKSYPKKGWVVPILLGITSILVIAFILVLIEKLLFKP